MAESKSLFTNNDQNKDKKLNDNANPENGKTETEKDNAVQNLIYYSFFPAICMVPQVENISSIREVVPDLMKAQSRDPILQETIKTFQHIMQEKDDEILNLQRQIQAANINSDLVEFVSESIQTELTLKDCIEMENRFMLLTDDIPEKNEKIHQLQQELKRQNTYTENNLKQKDQKNKLEISDSKIDDLDEAYKNLVELEEKYKELQFQYEDVNELKMEIEDAKIQREKDLYALEETLLKKNGEIEMLRNQLNNLGQSDVMFTSSPGKQLRRSNDKANVDDIISELKESIYNTKASSKLFPVISKMGISNPSFQNANDREIISNLMKICCQSKTNEEELKKLVPILKSVAFLEDGTIDSTTMENNLPKYQKLCRDLKKEQLILEALESGSETKIKDNLNRLDMDDLKKEYMKLENILNIINTFFKLTHLGILNRMSRNDLINGIIEKRAIIFEISLHSFWDVIFNQQLRESDIKRSLKLTNADKKIFCRILFQTFSDEETFSPVLSKLNNMRNILLCGELSKDLGKENILYFMKLYGIYLTHDLINHILPKYPRDIRGKLMEVPLESIVADSFKLYENISPEFVSLVNSSYQSQDLSQTDQNLHIFEFPWIIFDILSTLNFEDDLFVIPSKSQKNEFPGHLLSLSNSTKKVEKAQIKFVLQKNIKEKLIEYIKRIQLILNNEESKTDQEDSFTSKSDVELVKLLIRKKENLLKVIFKDTFSPLPEKMPILRTSRYFSCVSRDKNNLDFWVKMVLDRYRKEQLKDLQNFTDNEISSCHLRLSKCVTLLYPNLLANQQDTKVSRNDMIKMLFTFRFLLIQKLEETFTGKRFRFQIIHENQENSKDNQSNDNQLESIRNYFKDHSSDVEQLNLDDVLRKLYEIDCELFPGVSLQDKTKGIEKFRSEDLEDEIIFLRLAIASNMVFTTGCLENLSDSTESNANKWEIMKKVESAIFNSDLMEIDNNLIDSERILLTQILKNVSKSNEKNDEKLKTAYIEIKNISCRNSNTNFDMTESLKFFNSIPTQKGKVNALNNEVEKIMKDLQKSYENKTEDKLSAEDYMKLDLLLEDMEKNFSETNDKFKNTWIYSVYAKVKEIKTIISNDDNENKLSENSFRSHIINNLEDIKSWVSNTKQLHGDLFSRLNNAVRKLGSSISHNEKKLKMSVSDLEVNRGNYSDEKRAFEKALSELEAKINEIDGKKENRRRDQKSIDLDLKNKSIEELKKLILSMEKEVSVDKSVKTDMKEAKMWLDERSREQLEDDCRRLANEILLKKVEDFLKGSSENSNSRSARDNDLSQLEDEINMKLMKYQDLCDSVERLQIPQLYSKGNTNSTIQPFTEYQLRSNSPTMRSKPDRQTQQLRRTQLLDNNDENIDLYFKKRLNEIQNSRSPGQIKLNAYKLKDSDVLVDGFEIEEEKSSRYYSMRLQDIKHEQKEDELGNLLYEMEQQRLQILEKNKTLQKQIFLCQNLIENQQIKLDSLEKSDQLFRQKMKALEFDEKQDNDTYEDVRLLKIEINRLSKLILSANKQLDQQNEDLINLTTINDNLQQENASVSIKNKYLNHSFQKLEEEFNDLIQQLQYSKVFQPPDRNDIHQIAKESFKDSDLERKLRQSERDKLDLVRKLDIIDKQNELLKDHCEKLDNELSDANKSLGESQSLSENYLQQAKQLTEILDHMKSQNERYQMISSNSILKEKDDEIKRLKSVILQYESRLISMNQCQSHENMTQEVVKENQEITRLQQQLAFQRDALDEMKAQYELKEYECHQMKIENEHLQDEMKDSNHFPPIGYKLVKTSDF